MGIGDKSTTYTIIIIRRYHHLEKKGVTEILIFFNFLKYFLLLFLVGWKLSPGKARARS